MSTFSLKTTQASLNQTALDWPQNMANHIAAIDEAVAQGSDTVFLPELSATGYEVNDNFQRTDNNRMYEMLAFLAKYAHEKDPNLMVSVGHPWRLQLRDAFEKAAPNPDHVKNPLYDRLNRPFNVQTLIGGGRILGMTAKSNLFSDERGYENRYFNEWSFQAADEYAKLAGVKSTYGTIPAQMPDGATVPFGRPLIHVTDKKGHSYIHGTAICEEKWIAAKYEGHPYDDSRYPKLNIIPSISRFLGSAKGLLLEIADASPTSRLKQDKHMHLNDLASGYANVVIDTDGLGTSGATFAQYGHRLISQNGKTISAGKRMGFGQLETTTAIVSLQKAPFLSRWRAHNTFVREFKNASAKPEASLIWETDHTAAWDNPKNPDRWKEELIRNQALWMFDYMRKTKSNGIAEALSGGKDSSFNCAMVRVMVELAMRDLGIDGFCAQMSHLPYIDKIRAAHEAGGHEAAVKACMDDMLTAVYMGTNNSSYETWYAAKTLMDGGEFEDGTTFEGIGGKFMERNVQDLVTMFAFIFGVENSTDMPFEEKAEIIRELGDFVHASPYDYTPEEMDAWAKRLTKKHPQLLALVSAALPGHEIGYENFQARVRQVLIMAVANIEGKMAVANPNLDEAYGAYATFGGDLHAGTVNWNGGIHKADQEALMDYLEDHGVHAVMDRIVALAPANKNKPTAELQPKKDGEVVQNDEDALQGTFPQKAALARLKHHTRILTNDGERWMNAGEIYDAARTDELFDDLDDNALFNSVAYFYQRWEGPAQHKVHATPIQPTHGESVDHQSSLRTPNLSGGSRDEIVQLGIDILFEWAKEDGLEWSQERYDILRQRAWNDKVFPAEFYAAIWNRDADIPNMNYNLRGLYERLKNEGWQNVFTPLPQNHHILVVRQAGLQ